MSHSEYRKTLDGSPTVFEVIPASAPKFGWGFVMAIVFAFLGSCSYYGVGPMSTERHPVLLTLCLIVAGLAFWSVFRDIRPREHKTVATFRVSPSSIETNGQTFAKDQIHRLITENGINKQVRIEASGSSMTSQFQNMHRRKVAAVANSINLESGGKAYVLAGGMDETTAFGLLHDVSRIIGFKGS